MFIDVVSQIYIDDTNIRSAINCRTHDQFELDFHLLTSKYLQTEIQVFY